MRRGPHPPVLAGILRAGSERYLCAQSVPARATGALENLGVMPPALMPARVFFQWTVSGLRIPSAVVRPVAGLAMAANRDEGLD